MQIRVPFPMINLAIVIAFLSSLIMFLPCHIGEGEMHGPLDGTALAVLMQDSGHPLADAEFIPPRLATATETTASPSPGPAGPTVESPSLTAIATGARFVETLQVGTSAQVATDVHRVETTPIPLLTGLARNKPSIWGSKGFYVLLGLVYVTLLGLFVKQVISISGSGDEQR